MSTSKLAVVVQLDCEVKSLSASTQGPPHYSSHLWFNLTVSQSEGGVEVTSHNVWENFEIQKILGLEVF